MLNSVNDYITAGLTHSIHTSERRSFRGCRRRWDWISRQMYYPKVTARPLEFGVAFHEAMEAYYGFYLGQWVNPDPEAALQLAIMSFTKRTKAQREAYVRMNGPMSPEMIADYDDRIKLGVGMLKYYFKNVAPEADKGLKPVKVEIKFEVHISGPNGETLWCKCDHCWARYERYHTVPFAWGYRDKVWKGLPVTYGGRIDILFEDQFGRYWVGDWKTAMRLSGFDPNTQDDYLWNDDQVTSYCWALMLIGIPIAGFIYAEIKKAVPEEPEPLKVVRLGRAFSTSKQQNTTARMFEAIVKENDVIAYNDGLYNDYIDFLRSPQGPRFHLRHQIHRTPHELQEAGHNIYLEAKEMVDPDLAIYPNQGRFHCKGLTASSGCAFWDPCLGKNRGEDYQYSLDTMFERRTRHYWEDAPPSTESRMDAIS